MQVNVIALNGDEQQISALHGLYTCSKIAEAEAAVSVNEKK
jgi:hypothetical protein